MLFTAKVWCRQVAYRRLNMVEAVFYTGSRSPVGDRMEQKPKKKKRGLVRSLTLRPPVSSTAGPCPKASHFPLALYPISWHEGIQRKKVWSCPVRQDRAVHRRSEACMVCAPLASLPWLTVDLSGFPPPLPPPFPIWMFLNTC
nr:MAG TPA: hypothetical protein [Caudoviricetes sp.]